MQVLFPCESFCRSYPKRHDSNHGEHHKQRETGGEKQFLLQPVVLGAKLCTGAILLLSIQIHDLPRNMPNLFSSGRRIEGNRGRLRVFAVLLTNDGQGIPVLVDGEPKIGQPLLGVFVPARLQRAFELRENLVGLFIGAGQVIGINGAIILTVRR